MKQNLEKYEELCPACEGVGNCTVVENIKTGKSFGWYCGFCNGTGKIDWIYIKFKNVK